MGLATSHHAFPLCPAKLIQESLTSSDSICRQEHKCFLKYTICAHWSSYGGNCFSLIAFVYAEVYIWQEVTLLACFRSCSVLWWDFFFFVSNMEPVPKPDRFVHGSVLALLSMKKKNMLTSGEP